MRNRIEKLRIVLMPVVVLWLLFSTTLSHSKAFLTQPVNSKNISNQNISNRSESILIYPEEYLIYREYIEVIGGKPGKCDVGTIEATVLSITKDRICPGGFAFILPGHAKCRTEFYPQDTGLVRIDKLTDYKSSFNRKASYKIEPSSSNKPVNDHGREVDTASAENVADRPLARKKKYSELRDGLEVHTIFLLTTQPVIIKYATIVESAENEEISITSKGANQTTASHKIGSLKKNFKAIPKSENHFVFTTKVGRYPIEVQKKLPGLEVGSKFKATVRFNGQLYVEEYERRK